MAIKGERRAQLRKLVRTRSLSDLRSAIDSDGALAALYKVASCPQVSFAYPGGVVQSKALLARPAPATLRARVSELVAARGEARGWQGADAPRDAPRTVSEREPELGWRAREVEQELPELRLVITPARLVGRAR